MTNSLSESRGSFACVARARLTFFYDGKSVLTLSVSFQSITTVGIQNYTNCGSYLLLAARYRKRGPGPGGRKCSEPGAVPLFGDSFFRSPLGLFSQQAVSHKPQTVYLILIPAGSVHTDRASGSHWEDCRSPECRRVRPPAFTPCKADVELGALFPSMQCGAAGWGSKSVILVISNRVRRFSLGEPPTSTPTLPTTCRIQLCYWGRGLNLIKCISTPYMNPTFGYSGHLPSPTSASPTIRPSIFPWSNTGPTCRH